MKVRELRERLAKIEALHADEDPDIILQITTKSEEAKEAIGDISLRGNLVGVGYMNCSKTIGLAGEV